LWGRGTGALKPPVFLACFRLGEKIRFGVRWIVSAAEKWPSLLLVHPEKRPVSLQIVLCPKTKTNDRFGVGDKRAGGDYRPRLYPFRDGEERKKRGVVFPRLFGKSLGIDLLVFNGNSRQRPVESGGRVLGSWDPAEKKAVGRGLPEVGTAPGGSQVWGRAFFSSGF